MHLQAAEHCAAPDGYRAPRACRTVSFQSVGRPGKPIVKLYALLRNGFWALALTSCASSGHLGRTPTGGDANTVARVPPHRWQRAHLSLCEATVLIPEPVEALELEPGHTTDGAPVHTRKWRYETSDATFLVICERLDSGSWGPDWPRYAARGILTQFIVISTDRLSVHESPVNLGTYVGIDLQATSPADGSRLHARFITRDTLAFQLIVRHPTRDPRWQSAARTFLESFRPDPPNPQTSVRFEQMVLQAGVGFKKGGAGAQSSSTRGGVCGL